MKQKKGFVIGLVAFAVFLGAAGLLYSRLSNEIKPENSLVVEEKSGTIENSKETADTEQAKEQSEEAQTGTENTDAKTSAGTADSDNEAAETMTAPDFEAVDANGNEVKLSDYFGTPIVLNFWASWCGPCKSEMPEFDAVCKELEGEVQFLMVNMTDGSRETLEIARAFIEEEEYSFPVLYDTQQMAAYLYGVTSIPTTYFLDSEGQLIAGAKGAISRDILMQGIEMILPTEGETSEKSAEE